MFVPSHMSCYVVVLAHLNLCQLVTSSFKLVSHPLSYYFIEYLRPVCLSVTFVSRFHVVPFHIVPSYLIVVANIEN